MERLLGFIPAELLQLFARMLWGGAALWALVQCFIGQVPFFVAATILVVTVLAGWREAHADRGPLARRFIGGVVLALTATSLLSHYQPVLRVADFLLVMAPETAFVCFILTLSTMGHGVQKANFAVLSRVYLVFLTVMNLVEGLVGGYYIETTVWLREVPPHPQTVFAMLAMLLPGFPRVSLQWKGYIHIAAVVSAAIALYVFEGILHATEYDSHHDSADILYAVVIFVGLRWVGRIFDMLEETRDALEAANQRLAARNADIEQLTYSVAHDLRTPTLGVIHTCRWMIEDLENGRHAEATENAALALSRAERLYRLMNDLVGYARIGCFGGKSETAPLAEIVQDAIELSHVPPKFVRTDLDVEKVTVDLSGLRRVLCNLLENASRHVDADRPMIRVSARAEGSRAIIAVQDNGPGIAPKYHDRIFRIFETLDAKSDTNRSGMGLSICSRHVAAWGGRMWVESDPALHTGTTFFFDLPQGVAT